MGHNLDSVGAPRLDVNPFSSQTRPDKLTQNVEGLCELRLIAGKMQSEIAYALNITQPSVSKIEKQTDMRLSTLRNYIEAVGGELELTVRLPRQPAMRIHHLGTLRPSGSVQVQKKSGDSSPRRRHG